MKPIGALLLLLLVSDSFRAAVPPEVYSATFDYAFANADGTVTHRERISGLSPVISRPRPRRGRT